MTNTSIVRDRRRIASIVVDFVGSSWKVFALQWWEERVT
jgi:hypothetical protein